MIIAKFIVCKGSQISLWYRIFLIYWSCFHCRAVFSTGTISRTEQLLLVGTFLGRKRVTSEVEAGLVTES